MIYHIIQLRDANKKRDQDGSYGFFDKKNSKYWKLNVDGSHVIDWKSVWSPFRRAFLTVWVNIIISISFTYAGKANVNPGIVSTIFITNLIWVTIYFYFKEG